MKQIRINISQAMLAAKYLAVGLKNVFVYPGYSVERNIVVGPSPVDAEVTEDVYDELVIRELGGIKVFDIVDLEAVEVHQVEDEEKAKVEYQERQNKKG